jgi:photosystem II stability/assembly factor-like uncharacterized protein
VSFVDRTRGWLGCGADAGAGAGAKAILRTTDAGQTWSTRSALVLPPDHSDTGGISYNGYLAGIVLRPSGVGAMWMQRGVTQKTSDGGRTWADTPPGSFDLELVNAITMRTDTDWATTAWDANLQSQVILRSLDGGASWATLALVPLKR